MTDNKIFKFDAFELDVGEKSLTRSGEAVKLTPKVFDTLVYLVQNAGRLTLKDEMMQAIWEGRAVEESNLSFNIKMIRKALGDDATAPRFIETVPRRGFRFIADVNEIESLATGDVININDIDTKATSSVLDTTPSRSRQPVFVLGSFVLILFAAVVLVGWKYVPLFETSPPLLRQSFGIRSLSNAGTIQNSAVSPDGKYVVYVDGERRLSTIWLREMATGANRQIIQPSDDNFYGLAVSHDSKELFFVRRARDASSAGDIYRIPLFGGSPTKVLAVAQGWISLSPDSMTIAFVRCDNRPDQNCAIYIANSEDGSGERLLTSLPPPLRIGILAFSPDGRSVAFAHGQSENQSNSFTISAADVETGVTRELSSTRFFNVKGLVWLPGGNELLTTAAIVPSRQFYLWKIDVGKDAQKIGESISDLGALSIDRTAETLVATTISQEFRIRSIDVDDGTEGTINVPGTSVSVSAASIVFASTKTGSDAIWTMTSDGSDQRQLTSDHAWNTRPVQSDGGRTIYFASNISGATHVWRMRADGSDKAQVTREHGGFPLAVSPGGEWVYYHHGLDRTLWRISSNSVTEEVVIDKPSYLFSFSPDGSEVAFIARGNARNMVSIASIIDGQIKGNFHLTELDTIITHLNWMSLTNDLLFVGSSIDYETSSMFRYSIESNRTVKIVDLGNDAISEGSAISISPDEKLAFFARGKWKHDLIQFTGLN